MERRFDGTRELVRPKAAEHKEPSEVKVPREIEAKVLAPQDNPNYFISAEFLGNINGLLAQAGKHVADRPWRLFRDVRLKKDKTNTDEVAAEMGFESGQVIEFPLQGVVNDGKQIEHLMTALEYLGFNVKITLAGLVLTAPEKFPNRSVRFRTASDMSGDNTVLAFNVKEKVESTDKRGKIVNRGETEDVKLANPDAVLRLMNQIGYGRANQTEKIHRSFTVPAGEYLGVAGEKLILKTPTKIEINWPPGNLAPWVEFEGGTKKDVKTMAKLLGFKSRALRPISNAELYAEIAKQDGVPVAEVFARVKEFSTAEKLTIENRMVELQSLEQRLQSV